MSSSNRFNLAGSCLCVGLGLLGSSSFAWITEGERLWYQEVGYKLSDEYYQIYRTIGSSDKPHSNPTIYGDRITASSDPIPYIHTRAEAGTASNADWEDYRGDILYSFHVKGPTNSWVPVKFLGMVRFAGDAFKRINWLDSYSKTRSTAHIDIKARNWGDILGNGEIYPYWTTLSGSAFCGVQYECYQKTESIDDLGWSSRPTGTQSSFSWAIDSQTTTTWAGHYYGTLYMRTDEGGDAYGQVQFQAIASTSFNWRGNPGKTLNVMTYIDPYFELDPEWSALNPGATLRLPEGVGNAVVQVPEVESGWLILAGLGLLSIALPRRRGRATLRLESHLGCPQ